MTEGKSRLNMQGTGPQSGFLLSIISLCGELANWRPLQLQAPLLAKKVPQILCEKGEGEGARGTVHLWVSQMELVRLEFSSAKVIN